MNMDVYANVFFVFLFVTMCKSFDNKLVQRFRDECVRYRKQCERIQIWVRGIIV